MSNKSEIDELRSKVNALERQISGADVLSEKDIARHRDELHQASERRMSLAHAFSRADLAAMRAAAPDDVCKGIVADGRAPLGPKSIIPTSQQLPRGGGSAGPAGGGTGWMRETPIAPPPGIRYVDAQLDAQDRKDRADAERAEAMRKQRR
jgi:hypothetical protein